METGKKIYSSPTLIVHGDVSEITKGLSEGQRLDASFPVSTAKSALTFS